MKRILVLLAVLALASCSKNEITVVTFNTGVFSIHEGDTMADAAAFLKKTGADAIGLNELDSCNRRHAINQAEEFARLLGGWHCHFAGAFPYAEGSYGNAIVCRDRILKSGRIALPRADGAEERCVAYVETPRYVLAATHLDHVGREARVEQAKAINDWFCEHYAGCPKPVLLCGDFNSIPVSPAMETITRHWTRLSGDDPTYPAGAANKCLDYIFAFKQAAPVKVLEVEVLKKGTVALSDHLPVKVRLSTE